MTKVQKNSQKCVKYTSVTVNPSVAREINPVKIGGAVTVKQPSRNKSV